MDELTIHLYPRDAATQDEQTHFDWPNVGPADIHRDKQAVWDAFNGTGQPVFAEPGTPARTPSLRLRIGETGWQVATALPGQYTGTENLAVTDEARQARILSNMVRDLECDPGVSAVTLFHLIDDRDLAQFQTRLLRRDGSERPSFAAVRDAIRAGCSTAESWSHTTGVVGATAFFSPGTRAFSATATEDADGVGLLIRVDPGATVTPADIGPLLAGTPVRGLTVPVWERKLVKAGGSRGSR